MTNRTRSRNWTGTFFPDNGKEESPDFKQSLIRYFVSGIEICPKTTKLHFQMFFQLNQPKELNWMKKHISSTSHWEIARDTKAAANYCKKDGNFIEEGSMVTAAQRTDLDELVEQIKVGQYEYDGRYLKFGRSIDKLMEIYRPNNEPRNFKPTVIWLIGKPGVGKTRLVMDTFGQDNTWIAPENLNFWLGYENQKVALFDDFRGNCRFNEFLRIIDRNKYTVNVKYGDRQFNSSWIFITTPRDTLDRIWHNVDEDMDQLYRRIDSIINMNVIEEIKLKVKKIN